jgi:chromosome partitioning protein
MFVLSVCSLKGGVGKTSVTLGLASAALAKGVPTLVVDLDPQADATTGLDLPLEASHNGSLGDVLAAGRRPATASLLAASGWAGDRRGLLDVLPGSAASADHDGPRSVTRTRDRLVDALAQLAGDTGGGTGPGYRLVLLDCPPSFGGLTRAALGASDRALVVSEPALFSVAAADRALRAIDVLRREGGSTLQPLGVLVNRYRERSPEHRYRLAELTELFGPLVLGPSIPERSALQQAQGASMPVHQWPGPAGGELAEAFDAHLARVLRLAQRSSRRGRA